MSESNNSLTPFYIVWQPGSSRPPTYRHTDLTEAIHEAQRLANQRPNLEFYVLEAAAVAIRPSGVDMRFNERIQPEIPF